MRYFKLRTSSPIASQAARLTDGLEAARRSKDPQPSNTPSASERVVDQAETSDVGADRKTLASLHWSVDKLPEFSAFVQPLLNGMEIAEEQHRKQSKQLRHELIHFLDENNAIQDKNTALRRWKYFALGETLANMYPNMLWEKSRKDVRGRTKGPKAVFLSRLAEARRHRAQRREASEASKKAPLQAAALSLEPQLIDSESASIELEGRTSDENGPGPRILWTESSSRKLFRLKLVFPLINIACECKKALQNASC
ncbi:uncharacterized protein [Dermacentor andersoni]|uniref:uncharacterized protein n=1 Tax=Dermacentor andersoni TaxID=34620 RepID=UPI003B3BC052